MIELKPCPFCGDAWIYIFPMAAIRVVMRALDIKSSADAKARLWQCLGK